MLRPSAAPGVSDRGQGAMYWSAVGASVFFRILKAPGTSRYVPENVRVRLNPRACSSSRYAIASKSPLSTAP